MLVYDIVSGEERPVAIGRLKVEIRPCIQVGLFPPTAPIIMHDENDGETNVNIYGQVFLQQAETVRLGQRRGDDSFVRVTELENASPTTELLLRVVESGTHAGKAYSGKVVEK